jgi:hypothetical protein
MFKNWKTSIAGIGAILTGVATFITGDVVGGVTAIITGVGLIGAKDYDVTGKP